MCQIHIWKIVQKIIHIKWLPSIKCFEIFPSQKQKNMTYV
jgi:hypothetical protein